MNKIFVALFLTGYASFLYSSSASGNEEVKLQTQETSGNQSPILTNQHGNNNVNYFVAKNNSFQAKQEALLVAQNPTTLKITGLHWINWFGDSEPFLTVELTNESNLPAQNIRVSILDNKTGATLPSLKPYKLSQSYTQKILGAPIALPSKITMELPIAALSSVASIIDETCITGAGLDFQPPQRNSVDGWRKGGQKSLYIRLEYSTIFRERISLNQLIIIDWADTKSTIMIPRGTNQTVPLKCIGSHS